MEVTIQLPQAFSRLSQKGKRDVRNEYVRIQEGKCFYCDKDLAVRPPKTKAVDWSLFPENFLKYPVHLQHNHDTDFTEGAVHAYCNAVMWQYEGR
jgi:hypothetical protein